MSIDVAAALNPGSAIPGVDASVTCGAAIGVVAIGTDGKNAAIAGEGDGLTATVISGFSIDVGAELPGEVWILAGPAGCAAGCCIRSGVLARKKADGTQIEFYQLSSEKAVGDTVFSSYWAKSCTNGISYAPSWVDKKKPPPKQGP